MSDRSGAIPAGDHVNSGSSKASLPERLTPVSDRMVTWKP